MEHQDNLAQRLFDDYRYYRQHTASLKALKQTKPYLRDIKATPERIKLFASMGAWCKVRGIDPRLWLYSLFVARRWLFPPKLETAHLESEKHLLKHQAASKDLALYRQRQMEQDAFQPARQSVFDPNRDINQTSELAKQAYLERGDTQACMAAMRTETFGYHPMSSTCVACPAASKCLVQLRVLVRFDILALRRGEITSDQAREQALARVNSYGE